MGVLQTIGLLTIGMIILTIWSMIWKGIGMWYSARESKKNWFVCILIFNTAGILPIIYLLLRRKPKKRRR